MQSVKVKKDDLLKKLEENKNKHRSVFESAMEGYERAAIAWLEANLQKVRSGDHTRLYFTEPVPEDHTADYELTICMLQMSVDDEISLTDHEFEQYVMDSWGWKQQWTAAVSNYV